MCDHAESPSRRFLQFIVLALLNCSISGKMDWCTYWHELNLSKPECKLVDFGQQRPAHKPVLTTSSFGKSHPIPQPASVATLSQCPAAALLSRCRKSTVCRSGLMCLSGNTACCAEKPNGVLDAECPPLRQLGIQCNVQHAVNWCNVDSDCHPSPVQKCCPTGCNYNICVQIRMPIDIDKRLAQVRPMMCPAIDDIHLNCNRIEPVSWCQRDSDCQTHNSSQRRICCPTKCAYNVCLLEWHQRWIIA